MSKVKAVILKNESPDDHNLWITACQERSTEIDFRVVDLTKNNWLDEIQKKPFDTLLAKPGGLSTPFKQLYDERIYVLNKVLGYSVYPSIDEILIYENKRFLSYWLAANNLPHPTTFVFYDINDAIHFSTQTQYPIVAKTNLGASGSGVDIIYSKTELNSYICQVFSGKGAPHRWGPNLSKGALFWRGLKYLTSPGEIAKKLQVYNTRRTDRQQGYVIFQNYVAHDYEWRIVVIGGSYFAHKKLKIGEKASGSTLKNYDTPPLVLFDFAKGIMEHFGFLSQAIDVFKTDDDKILINEMQCIFGQSDQYQMLVDGIPGRYRYIDKKWIFESGDFNANESYSLRVDHIISMIFKQAE
jgi:glutathione synthase/RimK-type ligase-like ATP-grasp enzyme